MILSVILSLLSFPVMTAIAKTTNANSLKTTTTKLNTLQQKMRGLNQTLTKKRVAKTSAVNQLEKTDVAIGNISKRLKTIETQLKQQNTILAQLQQQQGQQQRRLLQQRNTLTQQFRQAYLLGQHQYIKMLLNQQNPSQLDRTLTYYSYINKARLQLITTIKQTLHNIQDNQEKITSHTSQLKTLKKKRHTEQEQLIAKRRLQNQLVSNLNQEINTRQRKLTELDKDEKNLERILSKLRTRKTIPSHNTLPFYKLRGKLPWPTLGKIEISYGTHVDQSQLQYTGVLINAKQGQAIDAISWGRVVFANWLKGYGLLLIIDHGKGYMTLYGHNNSLYKKVGDQVKPGELIATVGHSGGNQHAGLYFEIRHNGNPVNPAAWCHTT